MAPHQQHKTAVVALFLAALVLALPAAAYRPEVGYAPSTPAEAAPAEPAVTTPAESGTPVADGYKPAAADSAPAEETPSDAAVSTPTEATTPAEEEKPTDAADSTPTEATTPAEEPPTDAGYKPGEATSTPAEGKPTEAAASTPVAPGYTPAAEKPGKATTEEQKLMEMVNAAYKKALQAANAAAADDKFPVFAAAFQQGISGGLVGKPEAERRAFVDLVDKAVKDSYASSSAATVSSLEERYSLFVFTLTEALRVMAATLETHAVKPADEEAVAGGAKAPVVDQEVIAKIDAAVKVAAAAAKEAPSTDKFLVFEATFSKAFKDAMGADYDDSKAVPQLNAAYKEAYKASVDAGPKDKFDAFREALTDSITAMGKAVKAGAATKPAAKPAAEAAYKPAAEATAEAAAKPATEATAEPAAEAAYKPAMEATTEPAAEAAAKPAMEATTEPAAEAASKPAAAKPKAAGGYNL